MNPLHAGLLALLLSMVAPGQRLIADLSPGSDPFPAALHLLGVAGNHGILRDGNRLWSTDGTVSGLRLLGEFPPDSLPMAGVSIGGRLVMPIELGQGPALWQSDGSTHGLITPLAPPRRGGSVGEPVSLGAGALLAAEDGANGPELWITDGTAAGTRVLRDIWPGPEGSWPSGLTRSGNLVFFLADDGASGRELWRSDGTAPGTIMIADFVPGPPGLGRLQQMVPLAGGLLFPFGDRLWFTDGNAGTVVAGPAIPAGAHSFVPLGGRILFGVGSDLWATDGSAAGTNVVRSFQGMSLLRAVNAGLEPPVVLGGRVHFLASDGVTGFELWASDGTAAGTQLLVDLVPGPLSSWSEPLFAAGGRVWFLADAGPEGKELWSTDGTPSGSRLVADMTPGSRGSFVQTIAEFAGSRLLAVGDGSGAAHRVWRVDSNAASEVVSPFFSARGTQVLRAEAADEDAAMRVASATGSALLRADPGGQLTPLGRSDVMTTNEGEIAFLRGQDVVAQAPGASARVLHTFAAGRPLNMAGVGGRWYVTLWNGIYEELWVVDGAAGVTFLHPGSFTEAVALGRRAVLSAPGGLHVSDGTQAGTTFVNLPTTGIPEQLATMGSEVFFILDSSDLWACDGTQTGARWVATLQTQPWPFLFVAGTRLGFVVTTSELIVTDGTSAGTQFLRSFRHGVGRDLVVVDDRAFFAAVDPALGDELWVSDGTAAGTMVLDLWPGPLSSTPRGLAAVGDRVAFAASDPLSGREMWVSDGTLAGSRLVFELRAGPLGSAPEQIVRAGATVFFVADDGVHGPEPWLAPLGSFGAAAVDVLAGACAGSLGLPRLDAGYARLGDAGFALTASNARASTAGVMLLGTGSDAVQIGACALRVAPLGSLALLFDAAGSARVPVPVPSSSSLLGAAVVWQAVIADQGGALFGIASVSDGVRTVIGR